MNQFQKNGFATFRTEQSASVATSIMSTINNREESGESFWKVTKSNENQMNYSGNLWRDFPEIETLFRGELGTFLENFFQSHFKIFYGVLFKTLGNGEAPIGSQRWHSDSGPGVCVNVMFYLHDTSIQQGSLKALPWEDSVKIYNKEPKELRRRTRLEPSINRHVHLADFYDEVIAERCRENVVDFSGPAGLVVPFLNNTLHRGGHPAPGHSRTAIVFHCYPSTLPTDFDFYAQNGIYKTAPYPKNPEEQF